MADEATLIIETGIPIAMTVADSSAIEKGALLKLSDPFTVVTTAGDNDVIGGIAAEEKIANDGRTKIAVFRVGVFKMTAGVAGVTVGVDIISDTAASSANRVVVADATSISVVGTALETATNGQTFMAELMPRTGGRAS